MKNFFLKYIPFNTAARSIMVLNVLVIIFHTLVLTQVIPYKIVWAGKLNNLNEMYVFEVVSILVNILFTYLIYLKLKLVNKGTSSKLLQFILWAFVIIFALNTLGNLTAKSSIEKFTATPLTFILAILCCRIALEKPNQS